MFASNYLPAIEIGRRRRKAEGGSGGSGDTEEQRRRERRKTRLGVAEGLDEAMDDPLRPGETVSCSNRSLLLVMLSGIVSIPSCIHKSSI